MDVPYPFRGCRNAHASISHVHKQHGRLLTYYWCIIKTSYIPKSSINRKREILSISARLRLYLLFYVVKPNGILSRSNGLNEPLRLQRYNFYLNCANIWDIFLVFTQKQTKSTRYSTARCNLRTQTATRCDLRPLHYRTATIVAVRYKREKTFYLKNLHIPFFCCTFAAKLDKSYETHHFSSFYLCFNGDV